MAPNEMAPNRLGNTKARRFQLTLNEVEKYEDLLKYLKGLKTLTYLISCKEKAPTTGHEHIHIFICFSSSLKLSVKKCCGAHIEYCKGSNKQNIDYIKKDGDLLDEIGEIPRERGGAHTVGELKAIEDPEELDWKQLNTWTKIHDKKNEEDQFFNMLEEIEKDDLKAPEIIYICGDSGKGKTYKAYKIALSKFEKKDIGKLTIENNFIEITNDKAKCFVIEEFRPSQIKAASFLQLTDKYGYTCNIKGSFKSIRPQCIIIASIIKPEDLYKNEEINKQFTRRITQTINLGYETTFNDLLESDI